MQPTNETLRARARVASDITREAEGIEWGAEDLASAVTTTRIIERCLMTPTPEPERWAKTRSDDVILEERLRQMGDDTLANLRELEKSGKTLDKMRRIVHSFMLPSIDDDFKGVSGRPSRVQQYLNIGEGCILKCKARNTWNRYAGPWKKTRAYLREAILADDREWCTKTLRDYPQYVQSVAGWVYATTHTASAVESHILGMRLAMRINNVTISDNFVTKAVREVTRRERSKATRRRAAITVDEVREILQKWGGSKDAVKRMIAICVGVGFQCLLRWADMSLVNMMGIYWYADGCVFCLPRRKNNQYKPELVALACTGAKGSLFKLFKAHCELVTGGKMPVDAVYAGSKQHVFRGIIKPAGAPGHTWQDKRVDALEMDSDRPITKSDYGKYLTRFRAALKQCCGLSKKAQKEFGIHSMRVGGDTWLFENGVPEEVRMRMGGWATAFSERTYIRTLVEERLRTCKAMSV